MSERPSADVLRTAVELAVLAPSVHNTQPWRWHIGLAAVQLFADRDRQLLATDPDGRDLMLSCGAALHHLRVALGSTGLSHTVQYLPDPDDPDHLATVSLANGSAKVADPALRTAIERRRTDRRWFAPEAVSPAHLDALAARAAECCAGLYAMNVPATVDRLEAALDEAARLQAETPGYPAELALWTSRYAGARDGVPESNVPAQLAGLGAAPLRRFPRSALAQPVVRTGSPNGGTLLLLTTDEDDRRSQIQAGEATSAVLLAATALGLATTPLSQPIEVGKTRQELGAIGAAKRTNPQLIIRVGWPIPGAAALPRTPRRPLSAVLLRSLMRSTPEE